MLGQDLARGVEDAPAVGRLGGPGVGREHDARAGGESGVAVHDIIQSTALATHCLAPEVITGP